MNEPSAPAQTVNSADTSQPSLADFETSLQSLKELVAKLENGSLTLEESLNAFKEASQLAAQCESQLEAVDEQVRVITENMQKRGAELIETRVRSNRALEGAQE